MPLRLLPAPTVSKSYLHLCEALLTTNSMNYHLIQLNYYNHCLANLEQKINFIWNESFRKNKATSIA